MARWGRTLRRRRPRSWGGHHRLALDIPTASNGSALDIVPTIEQFGAVQPPAAVFGFHWYFWPWRHRCRRP
jgi:hypothetical protein